MNKSYEYERQQQRAGGNGAWMRRTRPEKSEARLRADEARRWAKGL